jgi:SAM-dependent methyltransferase
LTLRQPTPRPKRYDAAYYRRWYADAGVADPGWLARRAALAVALAEFVLGRRIRTALDVGAGTGRWGAALRRLRPAIRYAGVEASAWAVRRHGRRRGLVPGRFGELGTLGLGGPFDLVVCSDVLHYLGAAELRAGLPALAALTGGAAWLETYVRGDPVDGDLAGWHARPAGFYRRAFTRAGYRQLAPHAWVPAARFAELTALERLG